MEKNKLSDRIVKFIMEKDLEELGEMTLFHIAQNFNVSQEHLCRTFNREMNIKLNHFYLRIKLLKGAILMHFDKTLKISKLSKKSGFSDPDYFNKIFKKHFGKSPSAYSPYSK